MLRIANDTPAQLLQVAFAHHQAGRLAQAEALYRQILAVEPNHPDALHFIGVLALQVGQHDLAIRSIRAAIALRPNVSDYHANLGGALKTNGQIDDAIAAYGRAIALEPGMAMYHYDLGTAWQAKGRVDEAIASYRRAIALEPRLAEAHNNLGNALKEKYQVDQAMAAYERAIALKPDFAAAHNNFATTLKDTAQLDRAIEAFKRALAINPRYVEAHSNLVFSLPFHPGYDAAAILQEARRWDRDHAEKLRSSIPRHENDRSPDRRLRIGYVSPYFREHCQSFFTMPLLSQHDHDEFEIFCYADVVFPDATTARLKTYAQVWRPTFGQSDEQLAATIHRDRIDILVDLSMHMARGRGLLFARKPAPVQVAWLAYPGTTGVRAMDYRLTDPYLDPPGVGDAFYAERSVRLPDTFWCYDPLATEPAPGPLPALSNALVTFGSQNSFAKINDQVLELWAKVLVAVPGARLLLLAPEGNARAHVLNVLGRNGVDAPRVEFLGMVPRRQYLQRYQRIDVMLDSFPYNGHTTSLDALWMGVPVVTLVAQTVVGRGGLSQLTNLGLTELIAHTPEEFVGIATRLAGDLPRLAELRSTLRQRMEASPLMDAPRFAQHRSRVSGDVADVVLRSIRDADAGMNRVPFAFPPWTADQDEQASVDVTTTRGNNIRMLYRVTIEVDEDGVFVAECPSLPGCISQGKTRAEALANIKDAIEGYLASLKKHGEAIPPPISEELIEVSP